MNETEIVIFGAIGIALFFDFVNGFHDSANSVATVVGTKVLKPMYAVGLVLQKENTEKLFKDQYSRSFVAVRLGKDNNLAIMP